MRPPRPRPGRVSVDAAQPDLGQDEPLRVACRDWLEAQLRTALGDPPAALEVAGVARRLENCWRELGAEGAWAVYQAEARAFHAATGRCPGCGGEGWCLAWGP